MCRNRCFEVKRIDEMLDFDASDDILVRAALDQSIALELRVAHEATFNTFAASNEGRIRPGQFAVLRVIDANPKINLTSLSRAVGRDKSTLSIAVRTLVRDGLIQQDRDPDDKRNYLMHLTEAGRAHLAALAARAAVLDAHLDRIVGDDKPRLLALLRLIVRDVSRANDPPCDD